MSSKGQSQGGRARAHHCTVDRRQSSSHLWADRFDGLLEDVFELQDRVAISVAGVIEPTLQAAEIRRPSERPTRDLTAYDLYLRSFPHVFSFEKERIALALDLLRHAIERDPHYGPALASAALCHHQLELNGWTNDRGSNRQAALDLVRRALRSAGDDPDVLGRAAIVLGRFGEDIDVAIGLIDRCLTMNPSFAIGWHWSGVLRIWAGQSDLALEHFETALRLSPRDRVAFYLIGAGEALFLKRRFVEAVAKLLGALEQLPTHAVPYRLAACCYAHLGRLEEARKIVGRLRQITPVVIPSVVPYRNPEHRELFLSGLRLAAGETA